MMTLYNVNLKTLIFIFAALTPIHRVDAQEQTELKINKNTPIIKTKLRDEPPPKFLIVNYSLIQAADTRSETDSKQNRLNYRDLDTYLKFPIYIKKNVQLVGGLEYGFKNIEVINLEDNDISVLNTIRNKNFHRTGGEVLMKLNLNSKNFLYSYAAASLNFDRIRSQKIDRQLNGLVSFLHGHRFSLDTDLGYGVGVAYNSGRYVPFPIIYYSHYFSSNFKITALVPNNIEFRYTLSAKMFLYLLVKPSGNSYLVNENISATYNQLIFNKSDLLISTSLERELHKWLWIRVRVGYNIPVNYSFTTSNSMSEVGNVGLDVSSSSYATFTIFGVVPKTLLKKAKGR